MNAKNTKMIFNVFLGTLLVGLGTIKVAQRPFEYYIGVFLTLSSTFLLVFWDKLPVQELFFGKQKTTAPEEETEEERQERRRLVREENKRAKKAQEKQRPATSPSSQGNKSVSPDSKPDEEVQRGRTREQKVEPVKKEEPKKEEPKKGKKEEPKKEEPKKEQPKKEQPKKEESKKEQPKKEEPKKEEPKKENNKKDTKKNTKQTQPPAPVKATPAPVEDDDDGWEVAGAPVVVKPKKNKPAVVVDQLATEPAKTTTTAPAPAATKGGKAETTPTPAPVEEDDDWDSVVPTKKDFRQTQESVQVAAKKNKKKK